MVNTSKIDTRVKAQVREFVRYPFRLYKNHPQWVPPLLVDSEMQLNRDKHPFYEHSQVDFFIAKRDEQVVGRIAVAVNNSFNKYHDTQHAQFYLFDCEDDQEVANSLFERAFEWARERQLTKVVGPKGFGPLDGYGILVEGFDQRQMMNMMSYNYSYYPRLLEAIGFTKEVDFVCCYMNTNKFHLPERIHRIAERVQQRGTLNVKTFHSKKELRAWADRIGKTYNNSFVNNWEYYPLSDNEIKFVLDNILVIAIPKLIKVITHKEDVVGFLFGFPDVSAAMQRARGKLFPFGILRILKELRQTPKIALNGAGILPEYQGMGGNALLYSEIDKTVHEFGYWDAELVQVAETAVQMRNDLENIGAEPYKNHRVYGREL